LIGERLKEKWSDMESKTTIDTQNNRGLENGDKNKEEGASVMTPEETTTSHFDEINGSVKWLIL